MTRRFTAKDARELTVCKGSDYDDALKDIKECCSEGKSLLFWYKAIDNGLKTILETDGFEVRITNCMKNGDTTMITW
jgi:hypothetical protein